MKISNSSYIKNIWVVIFAAGKGKRMKIKGKNKVSLSINGIPVIMRTINVLKKTGIKNIIVVVGYAKESILKLFNKDVITVEQKKRLGTGHALKIALKNIPETARYIFAFNGDDSYFYTPDILNRLFEIHKSHGSKLTFLTIEMEDPRGLGRVLRDEKSRVTGIIEEKDATLEQKNIKEINPACYLFSREFLDKYINKIPKSNVSGEYYVTNLIEIAVKNYEKIETLKVNNIKWRGINTMEEFKEAEKLLLHK